MNYCEPVECSYNRVDRQWTIFLADNRRSKQCTVRTACIINCAGVWTDQVNECFGITSPFRHVFSKGVFIGFERPREHQSPLIFEMGQHGDTLTFIPWGPISLWGPTETLVHTREQGFSIERDDIDFLLDHAHRHLKSHIADSRIVTLRCGVRPLVVQRDFHADCYPLLLSRRHKIISDESVPWISVYGGKISGCLSLAAAVAVNVDKKHVRRSNICRSITPPHKKSWNKFPGLLESVPSLEWCVQNEFCCTLDDYLRRRTNIAQWTPRQGLGFQNENAAYLSTLCRVLPGMDNERDRLGFSAYAGIVKEGFDRLTGWRSSKKGESYEAA